jgi:hypothetical protein
LACLGLARGPESGGGRAFPVPALLPAWLHGLAGLGPAAALAGPPPGLRAQELGQRRAAGIQHPSGRAALEHSPTTAWWASSASPPC